MIANIGYALLFLQITLGILLPVFCHFYHHKISSFNHLKLLKVFTGSMFVSAGLCQIALIIAYVNSDYSLLNVYQNSHHLKPLIYKIAGSWGNHEGSMLLLISVLCFYNLIFSFFSNCEIKIKSQTTCLQSLIIALFAFYTTFASNPFEPSYSKLYSLTKQIEGLGLNPILQDIGLALHPPMLYTGYLGFSIVFSIMLASLINHKFDFEIQKLLKHWLYFAYGFLTLGIMLGSWWAYRELGWGGYWFFDPVENISLMPWLGATALIHSLKLSNQNNSMQFWSAFLAILCFILCLFGIFLTRSGILTSVHSFAIDANRSYFIIFIVSIIGGYGLFILGKNSDLIFKNNKNVNNQSKINLLLILANNYFLLGALFVLLLGTLYPIFLRAFADQVITVGAQYYQKIFAILVVPFLVFFSLVGFQKTNYFLWRLIISFLLACVITTCYLVNHNNFDFLKTAILLLSFLAFFMTITARQKTLSFLGHLGFILIILGVILSSFLAISKEQNLKIGDNIDLANYQIYFDGISYVKGPNFIGRQGEFIIKKNQKIIANLKPQLRFYPTNSQTTNEASIYHSFSDDLYIVIGNKDDFENYAVRIYYKPFISLIWLGASIIFVAMLAKILFQVKIFGNYSKNKN